MNQPPGLLSWDEVPLWVQEMRAAQRTIVLTNGVFDLLHAGHVRYLTAARRYGDVLLVGVNSDASTRALKGPERPIIGESERAELIAALRCVDAVVIFPQTTVHELLQRVRPDVWVKGGDWSAGSDAAKRLPEAPLASALGIRIATPYFFQGYSTTALIERIRGRLPVDGSRP